MPRKRTFRITIENEAIGREYAADPPFEQEAFENKLCRDIEGEHWPDDLGASLAPDGDTGQHILRYRLRYIWDPTADVLGVISCNPSGATRCRLDETLLRTVNQANIWGFGGIDQCNLIPVYESNSSFLHLHERIQRQENTAVLEQILNMDTVWLSWGGKPAGFTGCLSEKWNEIEDFALRLAEASQQAGKVIYASRLLARKGYRPPAHPSPRSGKKYYSSPLRIRIARTDGLSPEPT